MDKIIKSLSDMLETNNKDISELLKFSCHHIDKSSSLGSQWNSILSTFEIISPPLQTAKLKDLGDIKKSIILNAVLLLFPVKDNAIEITEIRFRADPHLSSKNEFVQYIDDEELINDISIALNLLERKPPRFWVDYKSESNSALLEDDYRSEFFRMLGMKYQVSSEEESKKGRTDLIIKSTSINRKIFEFKVWSRNNYAETTRQLLGYLTETDDSGFIIMANCNKNKKIKESEYETVIKSREYINKSKQIKWTKHGLKYFEADYSFNGNVKKIYHFIIN